MNIISTINLFFFQKIFYHDLYTWKFFSNESEFYVAQNSQMGWKHRTYVFDENVFRLIYVSVCVAATEGTCSGV